MNGLTNPHAPRLNSSIGFWKWSKPSAACQFPSEIVDSSTSFGQMPLSRKLWPYLRSRDFTQGSPDSALESWIVMDPDYHQHLRDHLCVLLPARPRSPTPFTSSSQSIAKSQAISQSKILWNSPHHPTRYGLVNEPLKECLGLPSYMQESRVQVGTVQQTGKKREKERFCRQFCQVTRLPRGKRPLRTKNTANSLVGLSKSCGIHSEARVRRQPCSAW